MSKELKNIDKQIARILEMINTKAHGPDSNELKLLQKLSDLYAKKKQLLPV